MKENTKIVLASVAITLGLVGLYFYFKKNKKSNCADFIKDGFVYNPDGSKGYAKKAGEWAGCGIKNSDSEYYDAINSAGFPIKLKITDVKVRKSLA